MCRSQKLNKRSLANAFCLKVSGCVIIGVGGLMLTIDPVPVSLPSLLVECPLAPESRLLREGKCESSRRKLTFPSFVVGESGKKKTLTRLCVHGFFSSAGRLVDALELVASAGARSAAQLFAPSGSASPSPSSLIHRKDEKFFFAINFSHSIRKI